MPKPVLQAMVLADQVFQDRLSGKFIIVGTFSRILVRKPEESPDEVGSEIHGERNVILEPPTEIGSPYLYLALMEVHGRVPIQLKFVDLADARVLFEVQLVIESADPVLVAEYCVPLPRLPANSAGAFSLDLVHDGELLGSWRVAVQEWQSRSGGDS